MPGLDRFRIRSAGEIRYPTGCHDDSYDAIKAAWQVPGCVVCVSFAVGIANFERRTIDPAQLNVDVVVVPGGRPGTAAATDEIEHNLGQAARGRVVMVDVGADFSIGGQRVGIFLDRTVAIATARAGTRDERANQSGYSSCGGIQASYKQGKSRFT